MRIAKIQRRRFVIGQHEGEDGVLHQVVVGATGRFVEERQIFKVGDVVVAPQLRHVGQVLGRQQPVAALGQVGQQRAALIDAVHDDETRRAVDAEELDGPLL